MGWEMKLGCGCRLVSDGHTAALPIKQVPSMVQWFVTEHARDALRAEHGKTFTATTIARPGGIDYVFRLEKAE